MISSLSLRLACVPGVHIDQYLPWGCCENYKNRYIDVHRPVLGTQ